MKVHISQEEFSQDLANTRKELAAYQKLTDGYKALSELPEHPQHKRNVFMFRSTSYQDRAKECGDFLEKLLAFGRRQGYEENRDENDVTPSD